MKISLEQQRVAAWEELQNRANHYPARVAAGKMAKETADLRCAEAEAIYHSIDKLYILEIVSLEMRGETTKNN